MKATDLMIGDWVLLNKNAWIDDEYDRRCGVPDYQPHKIESGEDLDESVNADGGALPIPLTQEILEKNGFLVGYKKAEIIYYHIGEDFYLDLNGEEILLKLRRECGYDFTFFGIISCKYVHELQHALKLCKIDKEIVL